MDKNQLIFKAIIHSANGFKTIAMNLYKDFKNQPKKFMGTQYFVNGIFAVELYLKAILLIKYGKYPKEHKLLELYNLLPKKVKDELNNNYPDFGEFLINENVAFENWRYFFEKGGIYGHVNQTKNALIILEEYCENINKNIVVEVGDNNE